MAAGREASRVSTPTLSALAAARYTGRMKARIEGPGR